MNLPITKKGYETLQAELTRLKREDRPKNIQDELGMIYGTHFGMISCQMIAGAGMNGGLFGGALIPAPVIHPFLRIRLGVQYPEFDPPRLPLGLSAKTH